MKKKLLTGLIVLCSVLIALMIWKSQISEHPEDTERLQTLRQHGWLLENYYTQDGDIIIPQEAKVIFIFDEDNVVHVSGLCNWSADSYQIEGKKFSYMTDWMSTEAICFSDYFDIMKAESEIRKSLVETRTYTASSEKLLLLDDNNNLIAGFVAASQSQPNEDLVNDATSSASYGTK